MNSLPPCMLPLLLLLLLCAAVAQQSSQMYESLGKSDFSFHTDTWMKTHRSWVDRNPDSTGCGDGYTPSFPVCVDGYRLNNYDTAIMGNNSISSKGIVNNSSGSNSKWDSDNRHTTRSGSKSSSSSSSNQGSASTIDHSILYDSEECSVTQCVVTSSCGVTASDTIDYYLPNEDARRR